MLMKESGQSANRRTEVEGLVDRLLDAGGRRARQRPLTALDR
jgi:hypothetical protein